MTLPGKLSLSSDLDLDSEAGVALAGLMLAELLSPFGLIPDRISWAVLIRELLDVRSGVAEDRDLTYRTLWLLADCVRGKGPAVPRLRLEEAAHGYNIVFSHADTSKGCLTVGVSEDAPTRLIVRFSDDDSRASALPA